MSQNEKQNQSTEQNAQVIDLSKKREQLGADEGLKWLRRAAHPGDIWSMTELVYLLLTGKKVKQDLEEGEKWLRMSAKAGEVIAMHEWGNYLIHGLTNQLK